MVYLGVAAEQQAERSTRNRFNGGQCRTRTRNARLKPRTSRRGGLLCINDFRVAAAGGRAACSLAMRSRVTLPLDVGNRPAGEEPFPRLASKDSPGTNACGPKRWSVGVLPCDTDGEREPPTFRRTSSPIKVTLS